MTCTNTGGSTLSAVLGSNIIAECNVIVDASGKNNGLSPYPGLLFGFCSNGSAPVSAISSSLTANAPNQFGLDLFTNGQKRLSITQKGSVRVGCISAQFTNLTAGCAVANVTAGCTVANLTAGCSIALTALGARCSVGILGRSIGSAPAIIGSSCSSSGIVGVSAFIPCLKAPNNCVAGVTGRSVATSGNITAGKGIGVRGLSAGGAGVSGASCISIGVVGTTRGNLCAAGVCGSSLTAGSTNLSAPTFGPGAGIRGRSGTGFGVIGASCHSSGVIGTAGGCINLTTGGSITINAAGCIAGVTGLSAGHIGSCGNSSAGVLGKSVSGPGVRAKSVCNVGVCAQSSTPIVGKFTNSSTLKTGDKSSTIQFQAGCVTSPTGILPCIDVWNVGVSGSNNVCSVPPGSFYIGRAKAPGVIISPAGLQVNGSLSASNITNKGGLTAKTVTLTASGSLESYQMKPSCFAVFADASGLPDDKDTFDVTLPPASSSPGMLVFIDKIDDSRKPVTIAPGSGDSICGRSMLRLTAVYSSVQLISDGNHTWYELSTNNSSSGYGDGNY